MRISGRILIIIATIITVVSALFCVIGLSTKGWGIYNASGSLFCDECPKSSQALSIISFLLLIATIVTLVLHMFGILHVVLRYIPLVLLFITTIFLLGTFVGYVVQVLGYSYNLMVAAHFFSYVALAIVAYWYGQADAASTQNG